jgi:putative inorganic carbon (HCO3(-)) transporter
MRDAAATLVVALDSEIITPEIAAKAITFLFVALFAALAFIAIAVAWRLRQHASLSLGLALLVVIVYANASDLVTRATGLPSMLQPLIGVLAIAVWWLRRHLHPLSAIATPLTLVLFLYVWLLFASTLWAKDTLLADQRVTEAAKGFAIYLLVAMIAASWSSLKQGMGAIVFTACCLALLSLFQIATGRYDQEFFGFASVQTGTIYSDVSGARIAGPINDPNFYGQILLVALPLAVVGAIVTRSAFRRLLFAAAALLIGAITLLTYSRGAMLALAVMTVIMLVSLRVRVMHIAAAGVAALLVLFVLPPNVTARFVTVEQLLPGGSSTSVDRDASLEKRALVLATSWQMFLDQPVLGVGAANFSTSYDRYSAIAGSSAPQYDEPGIEQFPHTLYMQIAAETGIAGLALFIAAMTCAFVSLYQSRRELEAHGRTELALIAAAIAVALSGYLLTSVFLHGAYQRYLWIVLGFAAAVQRLRSQPEREVLA